MNRSLPQPRGVQAPGSPSRRRMIGAGLATVWLPSRHVFGDPLLTFPLSIRGHRIRAELADTPESRMTGLMGRRSLPQDTGMLFVFDQPAPQAMWMKNTYVPLSVAFITADGRILNIEDMSPQTEDVHPSAGSVLYALEMERGWFARKGIRAGDRVEGIARFSKSRR
jgi:uncharacterized membrane protein (UPF0127 family)